MKASFPWFGGKRRAASLIWPRLGNVPNYVEPFFGSGAVLLNRPHAPHTETANDLDGMVANFWRAVTADPAAVAQHADWPVSECDLHARHLWLVERLADGFAEWLMGDPEHYDAKVAGWWVWGINSWIGSGFCSGDGPWRRCTKTDRLTLGDAGQGVNRKLLHLGNAGRGVNRKLLHLGNAGRGVKEWFEALAARLRRVRICCGDWTRVMGPSVTFKHGLTGIMLDPPYSQDERAASLYTHETNDVTETVRQWCIENGDNPLLRIVLCGYEGEGHEALETAGWTIERGKATNGGYGAQDNEHQAHRERLWFSPHCLPPDQMDLFG